MSSQPSSAIRFSCPQCGGNVKVPAMQAGQKCRCPRCNADIIAPGGASGAAPAMAPPPGKPPETSVPRASAAAAPARPAPTAAAAVPVVSAPAPAGPALVPDDVPVYPQPGADAAALRPTARVGTLREDEEFGVECRLCGTRLYARRSQVGTTVKCPDCHTPVVVPNPPKRKRTQPMNEDDGAPLTLSPAIELPSTLPVPTPTRAEASGPKTLAQVRGAAAGDTAMQQAARAMLEKARAEQEAEEAAERERSAERFTGGLFTFFADRGALMWLGALAVWFELAMTLFLWAVGMRKPEQMPAMLSEATSLTVTVALAFVGLSFLYAAAACGWALVKDTADGLPKVEHWPGVNVLAWGRGVVNLVSAACFAAAPGVGLGIVLGLLGIRGTILFTAAATFAGMFPPMLLSILESNSALAPFDKDVWGGITARPHPWKLTYLITSVITIAGLVAFVGVLLSGFALGLVAAVAMVACLMIYFRTVGRLLGFLAGRFEPDKPKSGS